MSLLASQNQTATPMVQMLQKLLLSQDTGTLRQALLSSNSSEGSNNSKRNNGRRKYQPPPELAALEAPKDREPDKKTAN